MKNIALLFLSLFVNLSLLFGQDLGNPLFDFEIVPENNYWTQNEGNEFNVLTYFRGIKYDPNDERLPLDLSIVIDKSGSMSGDKISKTKEAVNHLIDQLSKKDKISIVSYSDDVEVISKPTFVTNKNVLKNKINRIHAGGSTNLSGGLEKGYKLLKSNSTSSEKYTRRVILLSDGLANEGITDEKVLERIAKDHTDKHQISLTTMGVGADYNESLMTKISVAGTGNYYFIGSSAEIKDIFYQEFKSIAAVIAKNTKVKIKFPSDKLELRQVFLYNYDIDAGEITINLNDIFSENQKALVFKFAVKENQNINNLNFEASLTYNNPLKDNNLVVLNSKSSMSYTNKKSDFNDGYNSFAMLGSTMVLSQEKYKQSMDASEGNKFSEAENLLKTSMQIIDDYSSKFGKHPYLEDLLSEMKQYKKDLKEMQKKPKSRRSLFYKKFRFKRHRGVLCPKFR